MPVMKFKVIYEEDDNVFRDVEIKPSQTFEELEAVIVSSYNLPMNGTGQFYHSNDNWQKGKRIYPFTPVEEKSGGAKKKAKAQSIPALVAFIDDPTVRVARDVDRRTSACRSGGASTRPSVRIP